MREVFALQEPASHRAAFAGLRVLNPGFMAVRVLRVLG